MYHILLLPFGQKRNVKFRNNGISAVAVHYSDKGFYASCLIDVVSYILVLAEIHRTVRHAMTFFQNPHLLGRQTSACYYLLCLTASGREVCHELLYIYRYFEYPFRILGQHGNGYVNVSETKFTHEGGIFFFVDKEIYIRVGITEMMYEVRYQVRSYSRKYANSQTSIHCTGLVRNKFLYPLRLIQGYLCLTYYFFSYGCGSDILPVTAENLHIQLFFKFLYHRAQSRLRDTASLGRKYEMTVLIKRNYIFHLL